MKLPPASAPSTEFKNALGSTIPKEFAIAARTNPDAIHEMAETPQEVKDLEKEALVRQYVVIVDRSGSMSWPDRGGTRWQSAQRAVETLVPVLFKYDTDKSIPLYVFDENTEFVGECTDGSQISKIFASYGPGSSTNLSTALDTAMGTYLGSKRPNYEMVPGTTFIVLVDGGANDPDKVRQILKKYADVGNGYITNHTQAAVSFVQIGDDPSATKFLNDLDAMEPIDIVDSKKDDLIFSSGGCEKLLHDAIFD